jgi:hypothetical protein
VIICNAYLFVFFICISGLFYKIERIKSVLFDALIIMERTTYIISYNKNVGECSIAIATYDKEEACVLAGRLIEKCLQNKEVCAELITGVWVVECEMVENKYSPKKDGFKRVFQIEDENQCNVIIKNATETIPI